MRQVWLWISLFVLSTALGLVSAEIFIRYKARLSSGASATSNAFTITGPWSGTITGAGSTSSEIPLAGPPHDIQGCPYTDGWHSDDEIACTSNAVLMVDNTTGPIDIAVVKDEGRTILTVPDRSSECYISVLIVFKDGSACYAGLKTGPCERGPYAKTKLCEKRDWLRWRDETDLELKRYLDRDR